jgi:hypothetical protein
MLHFRLWTLFFALCFMLSSALSSIFELSSILVHGLYLIALSLFFVSTPQFDSLLKYLNTPLSKKLKAFEHTGLITKPRYEWWVCAIFNRE